MCHGVCWNASVSFMMAGPEAMSHRRASRLAVVGLAVLLLWPACAPRTRPTTDVPPRFPGFLFPTVPPDLARSTASISRHQDGWRLLQSGDFRGAERAFTAALKRTPAFYPAEAGLGYLDLATREYDRALTRFENVLGRASSYVPALAGRGEALLAVGQSGDALRSFKAALAIDPSLADIRRRVEVLAFRSVGEAVAAARRADATGELEQARAAYENAIKTSPDSGFLYRELASVELRLGMPERALERARKAIELDTRDAGAFVLIADIWEARGQLEDALDALGSARLIEPSHLLDERIERVRARVELSRLPVQYRAIADARSLTRGDLAALMGVRLEKLLQSLSRRNAVVMTDTRGHWASSWIQSVAGAGLMEAYANHAFQPDAPIRRSDLAQAVSRTLDILASRDPGFDKAWRSERPAFSDLPPSHLSYRDAAAAVGAGILPMLGGNSFQLDRPVAGAEAISAIERLRVIVR